MSRLYLLLIVSIIIKLLICDDECLNMNDLSNIEFYMETDGDKYIEASKQWCYPAYGTENIHPSIILYPKTDNDILNAVKFSRLCNYKIVIRSGGHQYDGLSSCNSKIYKCMQIDMKYYNKINIYINNKTLQVESGVKLNELNTYLDKNNYFLPGGEHPNVGIGGHILTGGDGYLSKTHGLLADYVISFDIILSNNTKITNVTSLNRHKLYWSVLGGGPGSFGIITKYELDLSKTYNDFYTDNIGFIYIFKFNKELFFAFGDLYIQIHEDESLNYINNNNYGSFVFYFMYDFQLDEYIIKLKWIWIGNNQNENDKYFLSKLFLDKAKTLSIEPEIKQEIKGSISKILIEMNENYGEIALMPYMYSSYGTIKNFNDEFIDLLNDRIELVMKKYGLYRESGMALMFSFKSYGGINGGIYNNDPLMIQTSFSYRKQLLSLPILMYYNQNIEKESKRMTKKWLDDTMEVLMLTSPYHYGQHDYRHISYTFGDLNINNVWKYYYKNQSVYYKLQQIKLEYDPIDLFHTIFTVPLPSQNDNKKDL
eukprot:312671_1